MKARNNIQGFTLIELMIVVALIAILLMAAGPSIQVYLENSKVRNVAESIAAAMLKARAHAISKSVPVEVVINRTAGTWTINELDTTTDPIGVTAIETFVWGAAGHNWSTVAIPTANVVPSGATRVTFNSMGRIMRPNNPVDDTAPLQRITVGSSSTMTGVFPLRVEAAEVRGIRVCAPHLAATDSKACTP